MITRRSQIDIHDKIIFEIKGELNSIKNALNILTDSDKVVQIEFYSSKFGIAIWSAATSRIEGHSWEDEDTVQSFSNLTHHFTSKFINGVASQDVVQKILNDVSGSMPDEKLIQDIREIIACKKEPVFDLEEYTAKKD